MLQILTRIGLGVLITAIACIQLFLLAKYITVRGTLRRMQETSSGDDVRYKNSAAMRRSGNGKWTVA